MNGMMLILWWGRRSEVFPTGENTSPRRKQDREVRRVTSRLPGNTLPWRKENTEVRRAASRLPAFPAIQHRREMRTQSFTEELSDYFPSSRLTGNFYNATQTNVLTPEELYASLNSFGVQFFFFLKMRLKLEMLLKPQR